MSFEIVPGDMIEWVYMYNNDVVESNQKLWSSLMKEWVPVGEPSLLISITEDVYFWFNSKGLFRAYVGDSEWAPKVVPRAVLFLHTC